MFTRFFITISIANYLLFNQVSSKATNINQLTFFHNDVRKALGDGKEVRAVFCDISKAFDRVLLLVSGYLFRWFSSYLSSRQHRVLYAGSSSSWSSINAGVPQGSILGPLLFLVYIKDITTDINANIRVFADDTSLYNLC